MQPASNVGAGPLCATIEDVWGRVLLLLVSSSVSCGPAIAPPGDNEASSTTRTADGSGSVSASSGVGTSPLGGGSTASDEGTTTEGITTDGPTTDGPTTDGPTTDGPTTDGAETGSGTGPACGSYSASSTASCGDGIIGRNEDCDCGAGPCTPSTLCFAECSDVRPHSLEHRGPLTGGVLGCNPASCRFDTSLCTWCGDGEIGDNETCEPEIPTLTCADLGLGAGTEPLPCTDLCVLDTSVCA